MNSLALNEEQRALQQMAADFLAEHGNARKARDGDAGLWQRIVELGWTAVQVPEELGGLGLGAVELSLLMEEMGRSLARSPFFATVVLAQTALLHAAGEDSRRRCLPALAEGARSATLILGPGLDARAATLTLRAQRDGGNGWRLDGEAAQVLDDGSVDVAYVAARIEDEDGGDGVALFEVAADAAGLRRTPLEVWDLDPAAGTLAVRRSAP
ncbi:acyl-CoA dehydrogenase family protein [Thauera sp. SDU_THAU2]|uniref:acyl-CoA dehydrogenase family protein n=1 Tax=Thauera sp. SDU_THAU2 TaxID=3136633 RepID=UPI00311D3CF3